MLTNRINVTYNIENIDADFDIFRVEKANKDYYKYNILDSAVYEFKAAAVQWTFGATALVLFRKGEVTEKQFKNCALSCAGAPGHRYLLAGFYLEAQMLQNHLFLFIAEADVFQGNACDRRIRACAGFAKLCHRFFSRLPVGFQPRRQLQKFSDTLRACQRLLDRLDFHANAFDWGKDSRNIGNYRNRRTD